MRQMTPEEDAANTRLRLSQLYEKLEFVKGQIRWEHEAFALRNPDYMVEWKGKAFTVPSNVSE